MCNVTIFKCTILLLIMGAFELSVCFSFALSAVLIAGFLCVQSYKIYHDLLTKERKVMAGRKANPPPKTAMYRARQYLTFIMLCSYLIYLTFTGAQYSVVSTQSVCEAVSMIGYTGFVIGKLSNYLVFVLRFTSTFGNVDAGSHERVEKAMTIVVFALFIGPIISWILPLINVLNGDVDDLIFILDGFPHFCLIFWPFVNVIPLCMHSLRFACVLLIVYETLVYVMYASDAHLHFDHIYKIVT